MAEILLITPRLPFPADDGGKMVVWNDARSLAAAGHRLDLICFGDAAAATRARRDAEFAAVFRSARVIEKDVERQHPADLLAALAAGDSYFARKYFTAELAAAVRGQLAERSYDWVWLDHSQMGRCLPLLQQSGIETALTVLRQHNVEHEVLTRLAANERNPLKRWLLAREANKLRFFEQRLLGSIDAVLAISPRDAALMRAAVPTANIAVLPALIDCDHYENNPAAETSEACRVVCVGNWQWPPNANGAAWFLKEVWPRVVAAEPRATLQLVGRNAPVALKKLAGGNVEFTGYVPDERPQVGKAHLIIAPILEGSGVRIKILTALAMGRRVLSTDVGAEGIEYPGILRCNGADDWVRVIVRCLREPPQDDTAARAYVRRHYDWRSDTALPALLRTQRRASCVV